jgi:hypothetical protein
MRYLASKYVEKEIKFTIGLSGTPFLWIFGNPYRLGGTEVCGISFVAISSGISDFFIREAVCQSSVSFLQTGLSRKKKGQAGIRT